MHHIPREIAEEINKDAYSSKTGERPQDQSAGTPGAEGVEASVERNENAPASQPRTAKETREIAHERLESDGVGGQG